MSSKALLAALSIIVFFIFSYIFLFDRSDDFPGREMESLYDLDDLLLEMDKSRHVLLGESTHGTKEYYLIRSYISKALIEDYGFDFIAVEGDWASIYELNKYVKLMDEAAESGEEAMGNIQRWPEWMWKNEIILDLVEWMRDYNEDLSINERVGFYGMDVYSPEESYKSLLDFFDTNYTELDNVDRCFSEFDYNFDNYVDFIFSTGKNCSEEIAVLSDVLSDIELTEKEEFILRQKINVLVNAEKHYRYMLSAGLASWDFRASHFASTVKWIADYYGEDSRGIAWAHNTHVGDSSHIRPSTRMLNIGRILREDENVFILGFVKNKGRVTAGPYWGSDLEFMEIPSARDGSYGRFFAEQGLPDSLFIFDDDSDYFGIKNHRAIGVVYDPSSESGNYVSTDLASRYDAVIFLNETNELLPL